MVNEIWKRNDVNPIRLYFGITGYSNSEYLLRTDKQCCLLGAALVGKKVKSYSEIESAVELFQLTMSEVCDVMYGFDGVRPDLDKTQAYAFGNLIKDIVNCKAALNN